MSMLMLSFQSLKKFGDANIYPMKGAFFLLLLLQYCWHLEQNLVHS